MDKEEEKKIYSFASRFSEPSSYAGIAAAMAALGTQVPGQTLQAIIFIASGVCGLVAFFLKEQGADT